MPKSIENTVFVRFVPTPQHKVMRHQLEDIFSQMGPIKKSSWINTKPDNANATEDSFSGSKGYGFIKFLAQDDAETAQKELNNSKIQMEGNNYTIKVELASLSAAASTNNQREKKKQRQQNNNESTTTITIGGNGSGEKLSQEEAAALLKKKSRIIVRNLSFYAKENHIRKIMEANFGKVSDVHLPRVKNNLHVGFCFVTFENPKDAKKAVDSKRVEIQKRSVNMDWSVPKNIHQQQKQEQQQQQKIKQQEEEQQIKEKQKQDDTADDKVADNIKNSSSDDSDSDSDSDSSNSEGDENGSDSDTMEEDDDENDDDSEEEEEEEEEPVVDDSVGKKCCLFLRNLPFDATRHDLFQLLHQFGHIKGIYLVKDRETGMLKGTAFVTYSKPQAVENAMEHASAGSFVSQRQSVGMSENSNDDDENQMRGSLLLKGRKILVDLAVDKETAATFDSKEYKIPHADRRNMYLQAEARVEGSSIDPKVDNTDTWDDLPQQDQRKRQTALKDKTAKLQSPIFFINPNRLSFRNMAKHVDEAGLQKLLELAVKRGLEKRLVGAQDQIAHWRALGEMSTRDILSKVQDIEGKGHDVIPGWSYGVDVGVDNDEGKDDGKGENDGKITRRNIIDYIPSVFIDRDYGNSGKKKDAPSRGFGFAEFTHHTHALACLRELNNNHAYSRDYAAGGRTADALKKRPQRKNGKKNGIGGGGGGSGDYRDEDGRVHVPRLVVDFVVENRVKANKQKERRLKQQLNQSKMVLKNLDNKKAINNEESKTKKRGRGAIQREKKKLKRESGEEEAERQKKLQGKAMYEAKKELRKERAEQKKIKMEEMKRKSVKPPKKKKSQLKKVEDDEEFEDMLRSYTSKLESAREENTRENKTNPRAVVEEKRWFE